MSILATFALVIGGVVFCIVVFIVFLAFIDCLKSRPAGKAPTHSQ